VSEHQPALFFPETKPTNVALPKEQCSVILAQKKTKGKKSGGGKAHQERVIAVINTDSLFNALGKQVTD